MTTMGAIEETRQLLQDFLAPELRAIGARLTAIEERLNYTDAHFDKIDSRFEKLDEKFDKLENKVSQHFSDLRAEFHFDKRLTHIETQLAEQKRPA